MLKASCQCCVSKSCKQLGPSGSTWELHFSTDKQGFWSLSELCCNHACGWLCTSLLWSLTHGCNFPAWPWICLVIVNLVWRWLDWWLTLMTVTGPALLFLCNCTAPAKGKAAPVGPGFPCPMEQPTSGPPSHHSDSSHLSTLNFLSHVMLSILNFTRCH